jgi:D-tyrosyl-tRNA(Tyr) deacylase
MRAVVQRVRRAQVTVDGAVVGSIDAGLCVLIGAGTGDGGADVDYVANKVANLRVFEDGDGKMNRSVIDIGGGVLAVSQFTLYGDARKGRRPTWLAAAPGPVSEPLYDSVCAELERLGAHVERGRFGADMQVASVNNGPVTLVLDAT